MGANTKVCPDYSLVIPLYNEAPNLMNLIAEISLVMDGLRKPWEILCVDDGSTDHTHRLLTELARDNTHLIAITLDRNYGQSAALAAGFRRARAEVIITLDGDGQNLPADIPLLINALDGFDLVCGYRMQRQDPWWRLTLSRIANAVRSRLCGDGMRDSCCALKVYRKACLQQIKLFDGMHRFLPALFHIEGYRIREIPVRHRPRTAGRSKYPFYRRILKPIIDLLAVTWMRWRHLQGNIGSSI